MTSSPKIFVSNYTSSTTHRGVGAKEIEIANARLDTDELSGSSRFPGDSPSRCDAEAAPRTSPNAIASDSGSYLQVIVEKHKRKYQRVVTGAQTTARLPAASSPTRRATGQQGGWQGAGDSARAVVWAAPLLTGEHVCVCSRCGTVATAATGVARGTGVVEGTGEENRSTTTHENDRETFLPEVQKKNKKWNIFNDISAESLLDEGPERVEVYRFERGSGAYLAVRGGAAPGACERAAQRVARRTGTALGELLAAPRLLLALPVALLLHALRSLLMGARGLAAGCVETASDYALKPALAVTFNALVQPVLVCARNVAESAREALRPAALALTDAVEPAARLLAAVRLVDVRLAPAAPCACACTPRA